MGSSLEIMEKVEALERHLLQADVRASESELNKYLADDFVEFGASGRVWNKEGIIASLMDENAQSAYILEADSFSPKQLADDIVLLTYKCYRKNRVVFIIHNKYLLNC